MVPAKISVIGLGVEEAARLDASALQALKHADLVIGSERQLQQISALIEGFVVETVELPKLKRLKKLLNQCGDRHVALLASGDPMFYGIGSWARRHFPDKVSSYAGISSVQAACNAVGVALQDVDVVSVHGRPLSNIVRHLAHGNQLALLTDGDSQPQDIARLCLHHGFSQTELWVCQRLGYADESIVKLQVNELSHWETRQFAALHVTVVRIGGHPVYVPEGPGISDTAFITSMDNSVEAGKGLITKKEVRLNILSLLAPRRCGVGWDIGAGCGGVSVEWAFQYAKTDIHAVEKHPERLQCLHANRERFGVNNLHIHATSAPQALADLPDPDAVFVGGSDGRLADILSHSWLRLSQGGHLVASAVTENSKAVLHEFMQSIQCSYQQSVQIAVNKGSELAGQQIYRPALPVTLILMVK
ncbi:Precorrin-6Y C(5,15)-methyltransferase [decarboxylating] [BD1-7 clade bacterium]|uniref:Precorrin-6Y C(5,15)-methyltransferase [decarboxylating] n=1 Tax=BD1-7 clade bacterium TaxID=2029982 RepID=A0A5S9PDW5_9GAMM|nr:Precorrin-6Y C(5,15)-methyltransferase [decarboxylating] [BD1-7 clade bacterium]CAA0102165.1 Precorrin-6Y C(5,15)-methyltransferase [decarboxylating] [BD1-7 clade bacterium]